MIKMSYSRTLFVPKEILVLEVAERIKNNNRIISLIVAAVAQEGGWQ